MLLLDSGGREIRGVTVFPDHADPLTWYYLPAMPHLSTVTDAVTGGQTPSFLLLGYAGTEAQGTGGFLNFDVNLGIDDGELDTIASRLMAEASLTARPRLQPVPLIGGTVSLQMLGVGTGEEPTPVVDGSPQFVLGINHPAQPSLYGVNQASFSVRLGQEGFTVVDRCLDGAILPIIVRYQLDYLGLRPAYHVKLKIDWDRVQEHMDETFAADVIFFSSEISNTVDELVEKRAIEFEADSFFEESEDNETLAGRRDAAVAQVRQMLTDAFFTPSIPPWKPDKPSDFESGLKALGDFAARGADIARGGGSGSNVSFSYKKTTYQRIDKKDLNVDFSERTTVRRTIYPQAHLGQVLALIAQSGRPREDFVRFVNVNDPRFTRRRLKVSYIPALAVDDIAALDIRADYAGQVKNDIVTAADQFTANFEWLNVLQGGAPVRDVSLSYRVLLKSVDTTERPSRLDGPTIVTTDDEEALMPEEDVFSIVPVVVRNENLSWDEYSAVNVELRYVDAANGLNQTDTIRLEATTQDGVWRMFVLDRTLRTFEVRRTFFMKDSRTHVEDWAPVDDEQVAVTDPFPPLRVDVIPPAVWTGIVRVFVDLRYEDRANNFRREESFSFQEGADIAHFRVKLRNPDLRTVFYTVTFQMADGSVVDVPESMTDERRISIFPGMKARRVVTVRRPRDFVARQMERVTVNLRFEDLLAGLSFADTIVFDAATDVGTFEYQIADEARDRYEYEARFLMANGMTMTRDWTADDAPDITIVTP